MADPYAEILQRRRGTPLLSSADPYAEILQRRRGTPLLSSADPYAAILRRRRAPRGAYLSGGAVEVVFDLLRTGEYAVGGILSRRSDEPLAGAALRGIRTREESGPQFARKFQELGAPDSFATDAAAFLASLAVDPINLIGAGLVGKGLRVAGMAKQAQALERVGPAIAAPLRRAAGAAVEAVGERVPRVGAALRAAEGRRALEPVLEKMATQEARGIEEVVDLGRAVRQDALRLTRNTQKAQQLDRALGLYFDAGADTMLGHIAQARVGAETTAQLARREATRRQALSVGQAARVSAEAVRQTADETIRALQGSVERALQVSGWLDEAARFKAIDAARVAATRVLSEAGTFADESARVLREAIGKALGITEEASRLASDRAVYQASQTAADAAARGLTARQAEQAVTQAVSKELRGLGVASGAVDSILSAYQRATRGIGSANALRRAEGAVANAVRNELRALGTNDRIVQEVINNYRKIIAPLTRGRTQEMASLAAQGVRTTLREARARAGVAERTAQGIPFDPETVTRARALATRAQEEFLGQLDPGTRTFVQKWAPVLAREDKRLAENLVRTEMMKPETAAKWEGIHLRRIYQKFEDPQEFVRFLEQHDPAEAVRLLGKMERGIPISRTGRPIPTGVTKPRQALEEATRTRLGEIREASSRFVAGGEMAERAVARGEAYRKVAEQYAQDPAILRALPGATDLFREMPNTPGWGALAGKLLPKEIADPLLRLERRPEGIERALEKVTGWWKFGKVILNPATHARNTYTNAMLAHNAAGIGVLNPVTLQRAVREVLTNGQAFREAKSVSSVFTDTFTRSELGEFVSRWGDQPRGLLERGLSFLRRGAAAAARAYEVEEQTGKMAVYLTVRGRGLSPETAAKTAELALFNYRKVPPAVDKIRRWGIYPFVTFPYKVATETLPLAVKHPGRFATQAKALAAFQEPLSEEERRALPPHMRGGGWMKLPLQVNGHPVLFDLTYILPWGDIGEAGTPAGIMARVLRGEGGLEELALLPIPQILRTAAEIGLKRSALTGRPIVPEGEAPSQARKLQALHLARGYAPTPVAKILPGGEVYRAVAGALPGGETGISRSGALPPTLPQAIAAALGGLRTVPFDVKRERRFRALGAQGAFEDVRRRMYSVMADQSLRPEEKVRRLQELRGVLRSLQEQYRSTGTVRP